MTKKFLTLLIFSLFFIAVALTSGCSAPIGGLLHGGAALDYIRAAPSRFLYGQNDLFKPTDPKYPLKVYGIFGGVEKLIDIDKVDIKIIENPGGVGEKENPVDNQAGYLLEFEGVKTVVISYGGMETRYSIAVGAPGTGEEDFGKDGGAGIVFTWEE